MNVNILLREERKGLRKELKKRKATTQFIGGSWALAVSTLIAVVSLTSLYATNFFGNNPPSKPGIFHYDQNYIQSDVFAFIIFGGVISVIIALVVPYMRALTYKQRMNAADGNDNESAMDVISTGTHRGMSRFHSKHINIYGEIESN